MLERTTKPLKEMKYGTSGFRDLFRLDLKNAIKRTTLVAIVRMLETNSSIGLMITASHNPVNDNGIKLIDHDGESIPTEYEEICNEFVNSTKGEEIFVKYLLKICKIPGIKQMKSHFNKNTRILLGRDTRPSSPELIHDVIELLKYLEIPYYYHHIVSTPELHYLTKETNATGKIIVHHNYINFLLINFSILKNSKSKIYFKTSASINEDKNFCCTFCINEGNRPFEINEEKKIESFNAKSIELSDKDVSIEQTDKIILHPVDTAYGVGSKVLKDLKLNIEIITGDLLNFNCGSDYVLTSGKPKHFIEDTWQAAFDGDADRIIYFKMKNDKIRILDGDNLCIKLGMILNKVFPEQKIGCVLSIYSNSKAINFAKQFMQVEIAETGVKNFIKKVKAFELGLFFEPNGHGSLHYTKEVYNKSNDYQRAVLNLLSLGDAVSNYLVIESLVDLEKELYKPNPIKDIALKVKDKNRKVDIGSILKKYKCNGFIRASGTEDVIRLHLEGESTDNIEKCSIECVNMIYNSQE